MPFPRAWPLVALAVVLHGCGSGRPGSDTDIELLPVEKVFELSTDTDAGPLIQWISDATLLPDGRVVALDGPSQSIHFLDAAGNHLDTVERPGEGPGEFRRPTWIGNCRADSLFVWDPGQARMTVLSSDGNFARQFHLPVPEPTLLACGGDGVLAAFDGSGIPLGPPAPGTAHLLITARLMIMDASGDSLAVIPELAVGDQRILGRRGVLAVQPGALLHGLSASPQLRRFAPDGRELGSDDLPLEPVSLADSAWQAELDRFAGSTGETSGPILERIREILAAGGKPDSVPLFRDLLTDGAGGYWLVTSLGAADITTMLGRDSTGKFLRLEIGEAVEPLQVRGRRILARANDGGGVQRLILYQY